MASVYWGALFVLSAACAVCIQQQYKGLMKMPTSTEFDSFQKRFLLVYFLACSSDWVQVSVYPSKTLQAKRHW